MRTKPLIAASILSIDFTNIKESFNALEQAGCDLIHYDVMDGHFVPNITLGYDYLAKINKATKIPFDVHLMVTNPDEHIIRFAAAKPKMISFHLEASLHPHRSIKLIKSLGILAGVALNPSTPEYLLEYLLEDLDYVLIMTVNPGFAGQKFIENQLEKISRLSGMIRSIKPSVVIEVDGGVDNTNSRELKDAGANILVSGSYLFGGKQSEITKRLQQLKLL